MCKTEELVNANSFLFDTNLLHGASNFLQTCVFDLQYHNGDCYSSQWSLAHCNLKLETVLVKVLNWASETGPYVLLTDAVFCFCLTSWRNKKDASWQHRCLYSVCQKGQTPTAVDLTPAHLASSPSAAPPYPHRLRPRQTPRSCRESSRHDRCSERISSGVSMPWATRRLSFTCMRMWK